MEVCQQALPDLNDYMDGTLGSARAVALDGHLQECASCRAELDALRDTRSLLRRAAVPVDQGARDRVLTRFRAAAGTMAPPAARWRPRARPLLYALATGAAAATLWLASIDRNAPLAPVPEVAIGLPSVGDIDRMTSLHAVGSRSIVDTGTELQRDALADANSRLDLADADSAL
jgi:anti-sigma factor RsiW